MNTLLTIIVSVSSAIIAGISASFIKPLVDWNFEKKRAKIEVRRKLINETRIYLSENWYNIFEFKSTHIYMRLAEHFSKEINDIINMNGSDYEMLVSTYVYEVNTEDGYSASSDGYSEVNSSHKQKLMIEINELSKKWELE